MIRFIFSKLFVKNLGLGILVAILLMVVLYFWLQSYTAHGDSVQVPDLRDLTVEEVKEKLEELNLTYAVGDSIFVKGAGGTVFDQIPAPLSQVKENRVIYLTLRRILPPLKTLKIKLKDHSLRIAETKLNIDGIDYTIDYQPSAPALAGRVIGMEYKGNAVDYGYELREGEKIKLIVGKMGNNSIVVPSLYGLGLGEAKDVLSASQLELDPGLIYQEEDTVNAKIFKQIPEAGRSSAGDPVIVWLTTKPLAFDSLSVAEPIP